MINKEQAKKTYICSKVIHAVPAKRVNGCIWPEGLPLPEIHEPPQTDEHSGCTIGVHIEDGYIFTTFEDDMYTQFMVADTFEKLCRSTDSMNLGDALVALKQGQRVARKGWNGKDMYVFLADDAEFNTVADISEFYGSSDGVYVAPMLVLRTAQGNLQPGWLASQADMLAEDWYIVE